MILAERKLHSKNKKEQIYGLIYYASIMLICICLMIIFQGIEKGNFLQIGGYYTIAAYSLLIAIQLRDFNIRKKHISKNSVYLFLQDLNPIGKGLLCSPTSNSSRGKTHEHYGVCMFISVSSMLILTIGASHMPEIIHFPKEKMIALVLMNLLFAALSQWLMKNIINNIKVSGDILDDIDKIEDLSDENKDFIHRQCARLIKDNGQIYKEELAFIIQSILDDREFKRQQSTSYKDYLQKRTK